MNLVGLLNLLVSGIRVATPLVIASIGLCYSAKAGMTNLSANGLMTMGAFFAVAGAYLTNSYSLGILIAMAIGIAFEIFAGFMAINVRANQTIVAMATNLLADGVASVFNAALFGSIVSLSNIMPKPKTYAIPLLCKIPIVGETLFNMDLVFYLGYLLVPVSWFVMNRTTFGLNIRMVGENPKAADTVGIKVNLTRRIACCIRGAFTSLAGAYISLAVVGIYTDNLISGKGYMSVSATIFGQWSPVGSMFGALVFGIGEALQMRLQVLGWSIPHQALQCLPYLIALILLTGVVRKTKQAASTGKVYVKD